MQLIIPISLPNHWALAVVDFKTRKIEYLDPAQGAKGEYLYSDAGVPETVMKDLVSFHTLECSCSTPDRVCRGVYDRTVDVFHMLQDTRVCRPDFVQCIESIPSSFAKILHSALDSCQAEFIYDDTLKKIPEVVKSKGKGASKNLEAPKAEQWTLIPRADIPKQTDS